MQVQARSVEEVFGDRDGERRAFLGIGGGAKLVEQHERLRVGMAADVVHVDDMRGEARKVALDRLRVADVRVDRGEEREDGLVGRDGQPGLRHQREQPGRFERDGFTAGIGPGDDQLAGVGFEREGQRHRFYALSAHAQLQQWMSRLLDGEAFAEGGDRAVEILGEAGADEVRFDLGENGCAELQRRRFPGERGGQSDEDAMDLGLFLVEQADEFVVLLDRFQGSTKTVEPVEDAP